MTLVPLHTLESASEDARTTLVEIRRKWGAVSPAFAILASNASVLQAQWTKHQAVMRQHERVTPLLKQAIALAVSAYNRCGYCTWSHANAAWRLGLSDPEVERVKAGAASDEPLSAIVKLARQIAADVTSVDRALFEVLRRHGFTDADLIEEVAVASYFNEMNRLLDALGVEAPPGVPSTG